MGFSREQPHTWTQFRASLCASSRKEVPCSVVNFGILEKEEKQEKRGEMKHDI